MRFLIAEGLVLLIAALIPTNSSAQYGNPMQAQELQRSQQQMRDREIYGSQLMSSQERDEYRERMRSANTAQEREQIRAEHHARMKERARQKGVTLPDEPPATGAGRGMSPGGGPGYDRGQGSGRGR